MATGGGFSSLRPSSYGGGTPNFRIGGAGGVPGAGIGIVGQSARQARYAMDTMGIPNFADLFKQFSGTGEREFGRAGAASEGADYARGQLEDWKGGLGSIREQIAGRQKEGLGRSTFAPELQRDRAEYARPTGSAAYQAEMGLARERTGAAAAESARQSAEAAQRRGYSGGYDPRRDDLARMQGLSEAGFGAVRDIRGQALDKYGTDVGGYGAERAQQEDRYKTDIGALTSQYGTGMEGYKAGLGAFTDLTRTAAELPTKWLSAISGFGNVLGGAGDFFRSSLEANRGERYDAIARKARATAAARAGGMMPGA